MDAIIWLIVAIIVVWAAFHLFGGLTSLVTALVMPAAAAVLVRAPDGALANGS